MRGLDFCQKPMYFAIMETMLDRFGRVVLPKEVRERLGLEPGAVLDIEETGTEIRLKPRREESGVALKDGVLVYTGKARGNLERAVESLRGARLRKTGGAKRR